LGFYNIASSLLNEILNDDKNNDEGVSLKDKIMVVDFNPEVHAKLVELGVKAYYGDISSANTLDHAGVHNAKIVISTIPDSILVGTDNMKILANIKSACAHAKAIVTAESPELAERLYEKGADYVLVPRILAAENLLEVLKAFLNQDLNVMEHEKTKLKERTEIIR
jgi:Trk K+ transport system NAD-binding subunit